MSPYSFGILFQHHFLVPATVPGLVSLLFWHPVPSSFPASGSGSGACLPTLLASCSIILSCFRLGLSPYSLGILFHHPFLLPARVPGHSGACLPTLLAGYVSLLFWHPVPASFPGSGYGSGACLPTFLASCSIILSCFRLGFRGLSPYSFGILLDHPFLVLARVQGLVSLLFWHPVPSSFPGSGWGSGACLPTLLASCSILISWFRLASCSIIISRFWLGFLGLSPYFSGALFHHPFLVPARVLGLVAQTSLELNGVLNSFKKQFCSTRLVPGILAFCSIIISFVLLVSGTGRVPGIVSLVFWHSVPSSFPGSG